MKRIYGKLRNICCQQEKYINGLIERFIIIKEKSKIFNVSMLKKLTYSIKMQNQLRYRCSSQESNTGVLRGRYNILNIDLLIRNKMLDNISVVINFVIKISKSTCNVINIVYGPIVSIDKSINDIRDDFLTVFFNKLNQCFNPNQENLEFKELLINLEEMY